MPAPTSVDDFLRLLRKSGLVEEPALAEHLTAAGNGRPVGGVEELADALIRDGLLTNFQARQLLQGRWKRFWIGTKYKLLELLGVGGMGAVYLAEHRYLRRLVALKVLPVEKIKDASTVERFYREARACAALSHPNIVHAYDIDHIDGLHVLVMEFIDGASFQEIVARHGPMDPLRAAHYAYQSAMGLQHAHEAGLVHRDVKPGNLLVDRWGTVKLLDLGLARFFHLHGDSVTDKYDEKYILGTAEYLAPEQAMRGAVDIRADVYGLGATLYFLLAGHPLFPEGTVAQKLLWHQTREPRTIRELRPEVPEPLAEVLARMLAKKPADRYQTPGELAQALRPLVQTPIAPPPANEMPSFSRAALAARDGGWSPGTSVAIPGTTEDTPDGPPWEMPATVPLTAVSAAPAAAEPPQPPPARRRRWVVPAALGGVAVLAVAAYLAYQMGFVAGKPTRQAAPDSGMAVAPVEGVIPAEEAARFVGREGEVELTVSAREYFPPDSGELTFVFLNARGLGAGPRGFTAVVRKEAFDRFRKAGIADVKSHYDGRRVRVSGSIALYGRDQTPQIVVNDPGQIRIVDGGR